MEHVGLSIGWYRTFVGRANRGWALDGVIGGGVGASTLAPGVYVSGLLGLYLRGRTDGFHFALGAVSPFEVGWSGEFGARFPVQAEMWLVGRAGPIWFGTQTAAGITIVPGLSPSIALQASVVLLVPMSWNIDYTSVARR